MTVFVCVSTFGGVVDDVDVFANKAEAERAVAAAKARTRDEDYEDHVLFECEVKE